MALVLLALPVVLLAIMIFEERGQSKHFAQLDLQAFRNGFLLYRQEKGRSPETLRDLLPLYVREVHRDPWNGEYRLEIDGGTVEIRSAGPNGRYGDDDDIVVDVNSGKLR